MSQITFSDLENGIYPDASDFNSRFNALKNRINSGVEADNIASSAVTTAKINNGAVTYNKFDSQVVHDATTVTAAADDYALISDTSDSNNVKKALVSDFFIPTAANALSGSVIQSLTSEVTGVLTGTALVPLDDTIPQQSGPEGWQVTTQAITPNNSSNTLEIEGQVMVSPSGSSTVTVIIYQDSTAGAIAAVGTTNIIAGEIGLLRIKHSMAAGTTSATTFKLWVGQKDAGTLTVNGISGGRLYGGVACSYLTVREIKA